MLALARKKGHPVEEQTVEELSGELEDSDDAEGFRSLRRALGERLSGLRVFRVGKVKVDFYLVGRTPPPSKPESEPRVAAVVQGSPTSSRT